MQLLYGVTLASVAFALALLVPTLLPSSEIPSLPLPHAHAVGEPPRSLCGNMFDNSGDLCTPRPANQAHQERTQDVAKCDGPTLLGIVHGGSADRALFAELGVVKQGEAFGAGFALAEVHANRTVLTRDGERCEVLLFPVPNESSSGGAAEEQEADGFLPGAGHFARRGGRFQVPRAELSNLARIRASPTERGVLLGRVSPASMAASVGLRSGDLVAEVNGRVLTRESAIDMIGTLATLTQFSLLIRRGAETFTIHLDIID